MLILCLKNDMIIVLPILIGYTRWAVATLANRGLEGAAVPPRLSPSGFRLMWAAGVGCPFLFCKKEQKNYQNNLGNKFYGN